MSSLAEVCALTNAQPDSPALATTVYSLVLDEGYDGSQDFGHYPSAELAEQARLVVKAALDEAEPAQEDGWLRSSQLRISAIEVLAELPELQRYQAAVDLLTGEESVHPAHRVGIHPSTTPWHLLDSPVRFARAHFSCAVASGPTPESALHRARVQYERARAAGVQEHLASLKRVQADFQREVAAREAAGTLDLASMHELLDEMVSAVCGEDQYADEDLLFFKSRRFGL